MMSTLRNIFLICLNLLAVHASNIEREDSLDDHRSLRLRTGSKSYPLDLKSLSFADFRYKLRHNTQFDFYFFTEVSGLTTKQKFLGPHGDEFLDSNGGMMHHETSFAADQITAASARKNGSCVVVDVGANFGYFSLIAMKLGCRVYLFEPDKKNFELSMLNFRINGFYNFKAFNNPAGLGSTVLFDGWSSMSVNNSKSIPISILYPDIKNIAWFKLDVEGFENEVVKSIPDSMHIQSLSMEITWYLFRYIDYNDTFRMIHRRFSNIIDVERGTKVNDLFVHTANLDRTACDHSTFCQFNVLCS